MKINKTSQDKWGVKVWAKVCPAKPFNGLCKNVFCGCVSKPVPLMNIPERKRTVLSWCWPTKLCLVLIRTHIMFPLPLLESRTIFHSKSEITYQSATCPIMIRTARISRMMQHLTPTHTHTHQYPVRSKIKRLELPQCQSICNSSTLFLTWNVETVAPLFNMFQNHLFEDIFWQSMYSVEVAKFEKQKRHLDARCILRTIS